MRPITLTVGPLTAASANNIALSQTPGAAGALTLNGSTVVNGVAILDHARRVLITTTDTTHSFTITGTSPTGTLVTESGLTGNGTSVTSNLDYLTVTSVVISGAATAAVTVGTTTVASAWARMDEWARPEVSIQADVAGTVNYTIQSSMDDPNSPTNAVLPASMTWVSSPDTNAVGATAAIQTSYGGFNAYAAIFPLWVRVLLNSGSGTVTTTVTQSGAVPY